MVLLAPAAYPDNGGNGLLRTAVRVPLIGDLGLYLGKAIVGRRLLRRGLAQAFYPQPPSDRYVKMVSSLWLGRKQVKAYLEDEACLNDSLRNISKRYSEIEIPVVIVSGDKDKIVSPDETPVRCMRQSRSHGYSRLRMQVTKFPKLIRRA